MTGKEDVYKLALLNMSDTVVITDEEGRFTFICPNIATIFGYSRYEVARMRDVHTFTGLPHIDTETLDREREICNHELVVTDKDGKDHILLANVKRVSVNGGTRLISFHDITERREAEIAAQKALNTKQRFLSLIAHDLRSPFTALSGLSEMLLRDFNDFDDDTKKDCIGQIADCSRNTHRLLENLLRWSEVQRGAMEHHPQQCDLAAICKREVTLAEYSAQQKSVRLRSEIEPDTTVYADEQMLALIIRNLLSNAIKFSEGGAEIIITEKRVEHDHEITVTDTGTGISEEHLKRLFSNSSHKLTHEGTAHEAGAGLGLLLCKEFAERNGGGIRAESTPGKGSRFSFTVPASSSQTASL